jgi:hypoxanthine phosphoribosyltransferase
MPERDDGCCKDCSKSGLSMAPNRASSSKNGKEPCSWFEIHYLVKEVARQVVESGKKYGCILAVTRGGIIPARLLSEELGIDDIKLVPVRRKKLVASEMPALGKKEHYLVIDDIYDTGSTHAQVARALGGFNCDYAFCMTRYETKAGIYGRILNHGRWIVFPWEMK